MTIQDNSDSRKKLSHIYNEIAKELFGFGTTSLKVTIESNLITFQAKHRRSPRSAALEGEAPALKLEVDFRMSLLYKKRLRERLEEELGLQMEAVLRDYDATTQWAISTIILSESNENTIS
jgi:Na+-translocating membrane potential-generating system (MpsC)